MPSPPDRGVARERTGLAWERSALSFATLAGVALAAAAHRDEPALLLLAAALVAVAALAWRHGRRAYARAAVASQPRAIALLALVTVLAALGAAAAVIASR
jgi:uncharacterized membrane protein YidH (DUF202 family)